mgnify:CR=1 FL=1
MSKFADKTAILNKGQYDATNLRSILENCKIFAGWRRENGWLQTFQPVSAMRNKFTGHNNPLRIRKTENNITFNTMQYLRLSIVDRFEKPISREKRNMAKINPEKILGI